MRFHAHDAEGPAAEPSDPYAMAVQVRGGIGHGSYDLAELAQMEQHLEDARRGGDHVHGALQAMRRDVDLDADLAPATAAGVHAAIDDALHGPSGVARLREEIDELHLALRYARMTYQEAEEAAHVRLAVPTAREYLGVLLDPGHVPRTLLRTLGAALLVGRLPVERPTSALGLVAVTLSEGVGWLAGHDTPDGIALDRAVRELGEGGQHVLPWFLLPDQLSYDGRVVDVDQLTGAQRLLVPLVTSWQLMTGRWSRQRPARDVELLAVERSRPARPTLGLPGAVAALEEIHIAGEDVQPGSIQLRRVDHADGRRSWTLLLPSTQAMGLGGANPADNLTNVQTYGGFVSDVEIGAVRAMELAGVAPGEEIAVVGFSQGGLTAMRLAADPVVRRRFSIRSVVTAGSPVAHLPTPAQADVLHLEHLEDPIVGLDGTANPAQTERTTVSRALTTGEHGALDLRVPAVRSHSVAAYAQTAAIAVASGDRSVAHVDARLRDLAGGPGARVTATTYRLQRG